MTEKNNMTAQHDSTKAADATGTFAQAGTTMGAMMSETLGHIVYKLQISFLELWSAKKHANSFNNTRSTYLRSRLCVLCYVWAALTIAWSPADFLFLADKMAAAQLSLQRLLLAGMLITIGYAVNRANNLKSAKLGLIAMVLATNAFYFSASHTLGFPTDNAAFSHSYTLLPIIQIVMLTIFPLTMRESLLLMSITLICHLWVDSFSATMTSPDNIASYWLQTVIAFMVVWSQLSQLHMILRLYRQATLDPLTGIYNRRMLLQLAMRALAVSEERHSPFSVLLLDLDKFKRINDKWGHYAGDVVLQSFTRTVQERLRKADIFGRFGGEEFIVFLPKCNGEVTAQIAERLLGEIREMDVYIDESHTPLKVTASIGLSTLQPGDTLSSLIERADSALYQAKAEGRDCIRTYQPSKQTGFDARNSVSRDNIDMPTETSL
ncbi:GGDEF domain-containing protein [Salinivibrio kushneri]|uniref:GGDEF domain-containing protein n=1 Tax=Salinivibrio kushneri TaxID=1908198 RepID=UPI000C8314F6|nr:GGDEF domain-containing protein [Salinivibrio kushneri]